MRGDMLEARAVRAALRTTVEARRGNIAGSGQALGPHQLHQAPHAPFVPRANVVTTR